MSYRMAKYLYFIRPIRFNISCAVLLSCSWLQAHVAISALLAVLMAIGEAKALFLGGFVCC